MLISMNFNRLSLKNLRTAEQSLQFDFENIVICTFPNDDSLSLGKAVVTTTFKPERLNSVTSLNSPTDDSFLSSIECFNDVMVREIADDRSLLRCRKKVLSVDGIVSFGGCEFEMGGVGFGRSE